MYASFEEKGKIFTNIVSKTPLDVIVQTANHRIHGRVYHRPDQRLIDDLTGSGVFLAITDATVYELSGQLAFRTQFIALHRDHIHWIIPVDELIDSETTE
ncbi:MAG: hypothetical protein ROW39_00415 [Anaerolineaceae bacterium]|jgi:hypothetical protein